MSRQLMGLKVKIGLKDNKDALYPNFNSLQIIQDLNMDWSNYVDIYGCGNGWHYDKTCGHREVSVDSPYGYQWAMLIVPEQFANQAVTAFPDSCSLMTENAIEEFYNDKAHVRDPDEIFDMHILDGIKAKQDLNIDLTAQQLAALDSSDDTPGIVLNKRKTWTTYKSLVDIIIKEPEV